MEEREKPEVRYSDGTAAELPPVPTQDELDARDEWIAEQLRKLNEAFGPYDPEAP